MVVHHETVEVEVVVALQFWMEVEVVHHVMEEVVEADLVNDFWMVLEELEGLKEKVVQNVILILQYNQQWNNKGKAQLGKCFQQWLVKA